MSLQHVYNLVC